MPEPHQMSTTARVITTTVVLLIGGGQLAFQLRRLRAILRARRIRRANETRPTATNHGW
jgi:hypothetical protein